VEQKIRIIFFICVGVLLLPLSAAAEYRNGLAQNQSEWQHRGKDFQRKKKPKTLNQKIDVMLGKLRRLEKQLNCDIDAYLEGACDENPASATASFCISQSSALDMGLEYAIGAPTEWEGGLGWAEVVDVKASIAPVHPTLLVSPVGAPIPIAVLPNTVSVGAAGDIGRGIDVCVDIPIQLGREDTATLARLSRDMNTPRLSFDRSKFQRRAQRVVSFADRRIPNELSGDDVEIEFDRTDVSATALMDEGWEAPDVASGGFRAFKDNNVVELLETLDMPTTARTLLSDPEEIMGALPDSIADLDCEFFGADQMLRAERPRLDQLCNELESLPDFERVRDGLESIADLPSDTIEAIADLLEPLLADLPSAEDAEDAKNRVCSRPIAQRRGFRRLCD